MAMQKLEDELDDLPATPKKVIVEEDLDEKAEAKPAGALKAKAGVVTAKSDEDEDLSVDFGDKELMKLGDGLERLRPKDKGQAVRFAILGIYVKARMAYTHFITNKGTFRCLVDKLKRTPAFKCVNCNGVAVPDREHPTKTCKCPTPVPGNPNAEGYCCKKLGEPAEPTIVVLVLHYKNADPTEGKYEKGAIIDWDIKYVQLTKANFQSISRLPEEEQTVNDIDVVMMRNNRAFGYDFHRISSRPRWKANPELVKEVEERIKPFLDGKKLDSRLGRKVTELEMKALISSLSAGAEDAKLGDVDSL